MSDTLECDVAIVGYGPTGVTAANLLGSLGMRVVVIERDADLYARARAISTDQEVMRIWQSIGLAERLQRDVLAGCPLEFVDASGRTLVDAEATDFGFGHPAQMFIYQPALEEVLRQGADRYPRVERLLGHECVRVTQDADGVDVTSIAVDGDRVRRVRASYLIAADGGSSPIRGRLNVGYDGRTYEDRWVVIDTRRHTAWPGHDRLRFRCDPRRPAVDCPTPLGHHRWEFPILPGEDAVHLVTEGAIRDLLASYGIGADDIEILRATVYSHHVRTAARWRVGRIFLAGDAAHAMPPWIGQGMAAGVRDAANLCWKLAAVVRGELADDVLDSYQHERLPHVREVTRRSVLVGRIITERRSTVTRVRDPALRLATRLPGLSGALQRSLWVPPARYRDGFLAASGSTAPGRRFPQPLVLDRCGAEVRLDDALGPGWAVLRLAGAARQTPWAGAGAHVIDVLPKGAGPAEGALVDTSGTLAGWMRRHRCDVMAVRPDGFVYAAGLGSMAAPPMKGGR